MKKFKTLNKNTLEEGFRYLAKKYPLPELTEKTFSLSGMTSCQFSLFRLFKVVLTNLLFGAL